MKITNKYNLPQALVDLLQSKEDSYTPTEKRYSVTTLLNDTRYILLNRRHSKEYEQDASQMINLLFGTATHHILEMQDKTGFAELRLQTEVKDGYVLSGIIDLYNKEEKTVEDWKTATVAKVMKKDFKEWYMQGLGYAYLAIRNGFIVNKIRFHALLKDWSPKACREVGADYPKTQVYTYEQVITCEDLESYSKWILSRIDDLILNENVADDDLPSCSDESTWYSGDAYKVYGKSEEKALRVFKTFEEAKKWMSDNLEKKNPQKILKVYGEYKRCQDYCPHKTTCKYYQERSVKKDSVLMLTRKELEEDYKKEK